MLFQKITIIGVGLIGASLGKAALERGVAREVVGVGRSRKNVEEALQLGCITEVMDSARMAEAVKGAEMVVLCTPVSAIAPLVREASRFADSGTIFTDAGSAKAELVRELATLPGRGTFLGGHPIAGKETSGALQADSGLFQGKITLLTPTSMTPTNVQARVTQLWQSVGARVFTMSPEEHDAALARTSHLPHVVACVLAAVTPESVLPYAGTGFQSATRLAEGSVEVWRDILRANRAAISSAIQSYTSQLNQLQAALDADDVPELEAILTLAKRIRNALGN